MRKRYGEWRFKSIENAGAAVLVKPSYSRNTPSGYKLLTQGLFRFV